MTSIQQQINEMELDLAALKEKLANEPKPWPSYLDEYYFWDVYCDIAKKFVWEKGSFEEKHLLRGDIFRTKEECELDNTKRRIMQHIKFLERGFVPDFKNKNQHVFGIFYDKEKESFFIDHQAELYYGSIFGNYKNREDAQDAKIILGNDLKILAGIK
jgi:hypothetical protein